MARTLIVLPDDTAQSVKDAIDSASRSLRIKMFVLSEPTLLDAVIAAKHRGVQTRVLLNPYRRSGEHENEASRGRLQRAGVEVKDANPAFEVTHEKSMVVDETAAFVGSFNWTVKNLGETRDYGVITTHHHDVEEIGACFDADWRPLAGLTGRLVEPGHQFEWAWLLERWSRLRGRADATTCASWVVVRSGRARTMARAIRPAKRSSP